VVRGAEVREGFSVTEVLVTEGRVTGIRGHGRDGRTVTEHARVHRHVEDVGEAAARFPEPPVVGSGTR
jgi:hypothetical protein